MIWDKQAVSIERSLSNKAFDNHHYNRCKVSKNQKLLRSTTMSIPKAAINVPSPSSKVSIIKTDYNPLNSPIWNEWIKLRDEKLRTLIGQKVRLARKKLKPDLEKFMKRHRTHSNSVITRSGILNLQYKLYVYCGGK